MINPKVKSQDIRREIQGFIKTNLTNSSDKKLIPKLFQLLDPWPNCTLIHDVFQRLSLGYKTYNNYFTTIKLEPDLAPLLKLCVKISNLNWKHLFSKYPHLSIQTFVQSINSDRHQKGLPPIDEKDFKSLLHSFLLRSYKTKHIYVLSIYPYFFAKSKSTIYIANEEKFSALLIIIFSLLHYFKHNTDKKKNFDLYAYSREIRLWKIASKEDQLKGVEKCRDLEMLKNFCSDQSLSTNDENNPVLHIKYLISAYLNRNEYKSSRTTPERVNGSGKPRDPYRGHGFGIFELNEFDSYSISSASDDTTATLISPSIDSEIEITDEWLYEESVLIEETENLRFDRLTYFSAAQQQTIAKANMSPFVGLSDSEKLKLSEYCINVKTSDTEKQVISALYLYLSQELYLVDLSNPPRISVHENSNDYFGLSNATAELTIQLGENYSLIQINLPFSNYQTQERKQNAHLYSDVSNQLTLKIDGKQHQCLFKILKIVAFKKIDLMRLKPEAIKRSVDDAIRRLNMDQRISANFLSKQTLTTLLDTSNDNHLLSQSLLCNMSGIANTKSHYATLRLKDIQQTFKENFHVESSKSNWVGNQYLSTTFTIKSMIKSIREALQAFNLQKGNLSIKDLAIFSNLMAIYTDLMLSFSIASRNNKQTYFVSSQNIMSDGWSQINDKGLAYLSRPIYLTELACEQVRTYEKLCEQLHLRSDISIDLSLQSSLLFFQITEGKTVTAKPYSRTIGLAFLDKQNLPGLNKVSGLITNANRHFLESNLRTHNMPANFIDAFMGHWNLGAEPWSYSSSFDLFEYKLQIQGYLENLFKALELAPVLIKWND